MFLHLYLTKSVINFCQAKVDNARKTGSGGGKTAILTELDNLVLDIIGKESPCILGLNQKDIMALEATATASTSTSSLDIDDNNADDPGIPDEPVVECKTMPKSKRNSPILNRYINTYFFLIISK